MTNEKIFVQIDDQVIELTGVDKETFLADREATASAKALLETEYKAKQDARASAITKFAQASGLSEVEIKALVGA